MVQENQIHSETQKIPEKEWDWLKADKIQYFYLFSDCSLKEFLGSPKATLNAHNIFAVLFF